MLLRVFMVWTEARRCYSLRITANLAICGYLCRIAPLVLNLETSRRRVQNVVGRQNCHQ